jgi:hypothetical protein
LQTIKEGKVTIEELEKLAAFFLDMDSRDLTMNITQKQLTQISSLAKWF